MGEAVGALTTRTDDAPGCGETNASRSAREFSEIRIGDLKLQGRKFAHVGMEVAQAANFSVQLSKETFAGARNCGRPANPGHPGVVAVAPTPPRQSEVSDAPVKGGSVMLLGRGVAT